MSYRNFWKDFAFGAGAMIGGGLIAARLRHGDGSRILRVEKSIQIAKPLQEVFDTWSNLEDLSNMSSMITNLRTFGDRSRWTLNINGVPVEWEAETTQFIPFQAIGWKSRTGPKHTGRITFSQIGQDTLLHIQMNYAPPMRVLRPLLSTFSGDLEGYIERGLREIKAAMENPSPAGRTGSEQDARKTGTHSPGPELLSDKQHARFGAPGSAAEFSRPREAKS
ncbi:MAG TPA: SRPBCC family protein [Terriglobales bacterium]|jgi:uncharacterized membrane protein